MKVEVRKPEPVVQPPETYDITGLTQEQAEFIRDLMGIFADNPGDNGIANHFHTELYCALAAKFPGASRWRFSASVDDEGSPGEEVTSAIYCLHCRKREPRD